MKNEKKETKVENKQAEKINIPVRKMNYGQIKDMRAAELDPAFWKENSAAKNAELIDYIINKIYPDHDFREYEYDEIMDFAMKTYRATYGRADEIKN